VICCFKKNEDKFKRSVRASAPFPRKMSCVSYHDALRALCVWLEDKTQSRFPVSGVVVGEKATGWWNLADITSLWTQKGKKKNHFTMFWRSNRKARGQSSYSLVGTVTLFVRLKSTWSPRIWYSWSSLSSIVPQSICRILGLTHPYMK